MLLCCPCIWRMFRLLCVAWALPLRVRVCNQAASTLITKNHNACLLLKKGYCLFGAWVGVMTFMGTRGAQSGAEQLTWGKQLHFGWNELGLAGW